MSSPDFLFDISEVADIPKFSMAKKGLSKQLHVEKYMKLVIAKHLFLTKYKADHDGVYAHSDVWFTHSDRDIFIYLHNKTGEWGEFTYTIKSVYKGRKMLDEGILKYRDVRSHNDHECPNIFY